MRHRHRGHGRNGSSMNFMEGIFSFVFGDGDPNDDLASRRWQLVGQYIQSRGGVVAAEELAPYLQLDGGVDGSIDDGLYGDEAFMMPVCLRFGGAPVADEQGRVLYRFPSLQITARQKVTGLLDIPVRTACMHTTIYTSKHAATMWIPVNTWSF